jgi:hypothetical protein
MQARLDHASLVNDFLQVGSSGTGEATALTAVACRQLPRSGLVQPAAGLSAFLAATVGNHLAGRRYRRELVVDFRQGLIV